MVSPFSIPQPHRTSAQMSSWIFGLSLSPWIKSSVFGCKTLLLAVGNLTTNYKVENHSHPNKQAVIIRHANNKPEVNAYLDKAHS